MCFSLFLYSGHDGHGHLGQNDFLFRGVAGDAGGGYTACLPYPVERPAAIPKNPAEGVTLILNFW